MKRAHLLAILAVLALALAAFSIALGGARGQDDEDEETEPEGQEGENDQGDQDDQDDQGDQGDGGQQAEWTFMLYWAGDNNLEFRTVANAKSMMEFGSNERVNLVLFADRHPEFNADPMGNIENFDGAKVFYVREGELEEIEDLEEVNDGDPAVLRRFVETCTSRYPARKYALILRNHGGGYQGACWDDSNEHDKLTLAEIQSVLAATAAGAGGKFEMVGFDMCLGANLEVAHCVAPYARYMAASVDLAYGSNYTHVMRRFLADPSMDGAGLARAYVEAYAEEHAKRAVATYSAVDLARIPALDAAVAALGEIGAGAIGELGVDAWYRFAEVQSSAEEYGTSGGKSGGLHLFDVLQLTSMLQEAFPETEVAVRAAAVAAAAGEAIIANIHGDERPNASGLSIYFPVEETKAGKDYHGTPFASANPWSTFVGAMTGVAAKDETPPEVKPIQADVAEIQGEEDVKLTSSVAGRDVDEVYLVIAELGDGEEIVIGNIPVEPEADGKLEDEWNGGWFTIGDGKTDLICPVTDWEEVQDAEDVYLVEVPIQVQVAGSSERVEALFFFRIDVNENGIVGEFDSAWVEEEYPYELELSAGDRLRPKYLRIDAEGEASWVVSDDAADTLEYKGPQSVRVDFGRVAAGRYADGFVAYEYAGNVDESYVMVTVK